jgi:hypothetical protein
MRHRDRISASVIAASAGLAFAAVSFAADVNTTGLPAYPHDSGGKMDAIYRSLPNGQHCLHYESNTPDALADVEAWYKRQMPGAKTDDVNKNSLYGSYFKLDGIKLLLGNDIVNIYRMADQKTTSIEMFKCRDAAHG